MLFFYKHSWLYLILVSFPTIAQTPHISGNIFISVKDGTIKADLEVSQLPATTSYSIGLNSGLNVQYFTDSTGQETYWAEREYNPAKSSESFQYWFPEKDNKKFLPKRFKVSYVGAFPVYADSTIRSEWGDWKGNIAFNGKTVRAAEQSVWYPILYDIAQDKTYRNVSYDLIIHAPDAKAIYLNGSPPQYSQQVHFKSDKAYPLLLFAGDFDFKKQQYTYLINTTLTSKQGEVLDSWFSRITDYYQKNLQIPYGADITLLASTPVSKRNDWLFVTYPTVASVSPKNFLNKLVDDQTGTLSDSSRLSFIAHELGHYYFGTVISPNAALQWVFLEGFTEYLSLQAIRDLLGNRFYERQLKRYAAAAKKMQNFVPLKYVSVGSQTNEDYRYNYIPLLLTALEQQIGRQQLWHWLRSILGSPSIVTDYAFFKKSLLASGVDAAVVNTFESKYLGTASGLQQIIDLFRSTSTHYYFWGVSKEAVQKGSTIKPHAFYTPIKQIRLDDNELKKIAQQYKVFSMGRCRSTTEPCSSDFNVYESLEEARSAQTRWLKNLSADYRLEQVEF